MAILLSLFAGVIVFFPVPFMFFVELGLAKAAAFETCLEIAVLVCVAAKFLWERSRLASCAIALIALFAAILMFADVIPNFYHATRIWFDDLYDKWFGWAWQ